MSLGIGFLLSLWLLPLIVFVYCVARKPDKVGFITGITIGTIASPASLGLYGLFYSGNSFGFVGLLLSFLHVYLPSLVATKVGIIPPNTPVDGVYVWYLAIVSAGIWGFIYGAIGLLIDNMIGLVPKET